MASSSPIPAAAEDRVLAAIVFTDVVGFSARMQTKESDTLKLLEKDFSAMRDLGTTLSGSVIKTTGDGLLLFFKSAVQAMEWSLQIQRQFSGHVRKLPPGEFLQHRVGVHVGDVFFAGGDVMGDGVNIAARVQTEAPAGGICISQSVYDLVKNKMKLDVIRLEPRKLKNIGESIQMYHVLVEPRAAAAAPAASAAPIPSRLPPAPPPRSKFPIVAGIMIVGGIAAWLVHAYFEHQREMAQSQQAALALDAQLQKKASAPTAAPADAPATTPTTVAPAANELEFAQRAVKSGPADERTRSEASAALEPMLAWTKAEVQRYSGQRPLRVQALGQSTAQTIFADANGLINFVGGGGGAVRPRNWTDLRPEQQGAIILALIGYATTPPPPEVIRGAGAFAYVHQLPDMARGLIDRR
jgi:class 3 adenylate cyclase